MKLPRVLGRPTVILANSGVAPLFKPPRCPSPACPAHLHPEAIQGRFYTTNAMARDLAGRRRRESWLVSKARRYPRLQLHVFAAFRNFIRRRVNRQQPTPAQLPGFLPRPATFEELLSWRQDWKSRSIHPLTSSERSIAEIRGREMAA